MYVSKFDKGLLATDVLMAKVLKRISVVGRRASDACLLPAKSSTQSGAGGPTEQLLQYLAQIGEKRHMVLACD